MMHLRGSRVRTRTKARRLAASRISKKITTAAPREKAFVQRRLTHTPGEQYSEPPHLGRVALGAGVDEGAVGDFVHGHTQGAHVGAHAESALGLAPLHARLHQRVERHRVRLQQLLLLHVHKHLPPRESPQPPNRLPQVVR